MRKRGFCNFCFALDVGWVQVFEVGFSGVAQHVNQLVSLAKSTMGVVWKQTSHTRAAACGGAPKGEGSDKGSFASCHLFLRRWSIDSFRDEQSLSFAARHSPRHEAEMTKLPIVEKE